MTEIDPLCADFLDLADYDLDAARNAECRMLVHSLRFLGCNMPRMHQAVEGFRLSNVKRADEVDSLACAAIDEIRERRRLLGIDKDCLDLLGCWLTFCTQGLEEQRISLAIEFARRTMSSGQNTQIRRPKNAAEIDAEITEWVCGLLEEARSEVL